MSALPDDPGHFARWLEANGHPAGFAPRLVYGRYLDGLLDEAMARAGDRLTILTGEAVDVEPGGEGATVRLADGRAVAADSVVLAPGNLPPHVPPGLNPAILPEGSWFGDPWAADIAEGLAADDTVLVLGTGLTMVDIALLLEARGFTGRIVALSRHGLPPRAHAEGGRPSTRSERPRPTVVACLRSLRERADEVGWRAAVDEMRPYTQGLWRAAPLDERRRFLRHARAWWDVHRHRLAPRVAERIAGLQERGQLAVCAGKLIGAAPEGGRIRVRYRPRHGEGEDSLLVSRIVNGTGPQSDLGRSAEPLLHALQGRGLIRPDPLQIGIDVDQESQVIGADGDALPWLAAVGPMTRGAFWEIVAVPDIRRQAWSVARRLSNAQWVEGEGL